MKTNITLQNTQNINSVQNIVANSLAGVANLYSEILGEKVTTRQTLHLLNAQIAFLGIILPSGALAVNALAVAWFALALRGCKRAGL